MTYEELIALIDENVLSGGRRTKGNGLRTVLYALATEATNDPDVSPYLLKAGGVITGNIQAGDNLGLVYCTNNFILRKGKNW
jgi:predicted transcriptional regulator